LIKEKLVFYQARLGQRGGGGRKGFARAERGPRGLKIKSREKRAAGSHLSSMQQG
jgi:hypothetical protein